MLLQVQENFTVLTVMHHILSVSVQPLIRASPLFLTAELWHQRLCALLLHG
jgi:hypothetical protein